MSQLKHSFFIIGPLGNRYILYIISRFKECCAGISFTQIYICQVQIGYIIYSNLSFKSIYYNEMHILCKFEQLYPI